MPRTLSATLTGSIFPYTTLFGSSGRRRQVGHLGLDRQGRPSPRAVALAIRRRAHGRGEQVEASAQAPRRSFRRVGLEVEVELVVEAEALEGALELACRAGRLRTRVVEDQVDASDAAPLDRPRDEPAPAPPGGRRDVAAGLRAA